MNMKQQNNVRAVMSLFFAVTFTSCVNHFVPDNLDAYDPDASFTTTVFRPVLGRTTLFSNAFNAGNSTLPMDFEITSITKADGSPAPELTDVFPVRVWEKPYLGTETSLEEIEAKRGIEYRRLFDVRQHSGEFIMWENANSSFVECAPKDGYIFTVKASNSGGYKYTTGLQLIPQREAEYEPSPVDPETGLVSTEYVTPTSIRRFYTEDYYLLPLEDIHVYFRRNLELEEQGNMNSLTFRFYNPDWTPINPRCFNETKWDNLLHGFNMELTNEYVRYQVAYPIPLLNGLVTKYTNTTGDRAQATFATSWMFRENVRIWSSVSLEFAIYSEGSWEIIFFFSGDKPKLATVE